MLIVSAFILVWILAVIFASMRISRIVQAEPAQKPPPDPIVTLVDKWAHDWERGRA